MELIKTGKALVGPLYYAPQVHIFKLEIDFKNIKPPVNFSFSLAQRFKKIIFSTESSFFKDLNFDFFEEFGVKTFPFNMSGLKINFYLESSNHPLSKEQKMGFDIY